MRSLEWDRSSEISRLRELIWLHLPSAAELGDLGVRAARLLQLPEEDLRLLGEIHFLLSEEVGQLLEILPRLMRRLATTTVSDEEWSVDRIRGAVHWSRTLSARHSLGIPHLYVTAPSRRAHQTPENELLAYELDSISQIARRTLGLQFTGGLGDRIATRLAAAESFRRRRLLAEIERVRPNDRSLARVKNGRACHRYQPVIDAHEKQRALVAEPSASDLRDAIEKTALVTRRDDILFEVRSVFDVLEALDDLGWAVAPLKLFGLPRALKATAERGRQNLDIWYQHVPRGLRKGSRYTKVLEAHSFPGQSIQPQRPDAVLRLRQPGGEERWIVIEMKLGTKREVAASARAALADLLAYRRDFSQVLDQQEGPYGIGIAWGAGLVPGDDDEALLCTNDEIASALKQAIPPA